MKPVEGKKAVQAENDPVTEEQKTQLRQLIDRFGLRHTEFLQRLAELCRLAQRSDLYPDLVEGHSTLLGCYEQFLVMRIGLPDGQEFWDQLLDAIAKSKQAVEAPKPEPGPRFRN